MKVIKRDGHMVDWCPEKVENAILKANNEVEEEEKNFSWRYPGYNWNEINGARKVWTC